MIDFTKPVQTRDGREVRVLCTDREDARPVVGLVNREHAGEELYAWCASGNYMSNIHGLDLVNVPEKRVVWVNMYPDCACDYPSKETADEAAATDREACIRVEYEVGRFDEESEDPETEFMMGL